MPEKIRIIALDLDGTLLNSRKELSPGNLAALEQAAAAGVEVVPTTGRFYGGMPECIRALPFVRYAITVNGAAVTELKSGRLLYHAEIPLPEALQLLEALDGYPLLYDSYVENAAYMTGAQKARIEEEISDPHYRNMLRELRQPVPELKEYLRSRGRDVQKVQCFTGRPELRLQLLRELPERFPDLCVSSSIPENLEINQLRANKGAALLALAKELGVPREATAAFGDGLNDLSMIRAAGVGVAMENACPEALEAADLRTRSCDADGVARGIEALCFGKPL